MKRKFFYLIIVAMLGALVLSACSGEGETTADGSTTTDGGSEKFVLKFTSPAPESAVFSQANEALAKYIEENSDGRISFERYYGGSLVKAGDELDALSTGIIDMAVFSNSYVPGKLPLATISTTVSLWEDAWVGSKAFYDLYKQNASLQEELGQYGVVHLGNFSLPGSYMLSTKEVNSLDQLKKMNIVANGQAANLAKALGANAVSVPVEDLYETITKGTADAVFYGTVEGVTFGLTGEIKNIYQIPIGGEAGLVVMNEKTYNSLPADLQQLLDQALNEEYPRILHEIFQVEGAGNATQELIDNGAVITEPTEADYNKVVEVAKTQIWDEWAKNLEKENHKVDDLLTNLETLIKKYEEDPENPNNK